MEAGEPLFVARDPMESALRFTMFSETTGIGPDSLLASTLCATPLPIYPSGWPENRRRWPGTNAEVMWHPLLWLPKRLAGRYRITRADGTTAPESDDAWAVRIALELTFSGLYDDATGTWADVLSMYDIDLAMPEQLMRVQSWLDGAPDDALDAIDLSEHVDLPEDRAWAVAAADAMLPELRTTAWALAADSLLEAVDNLAERVDAEEIDVAEARWHAGMIAFLANDYFRSMPDPLDGEPSQSFWTAVTDRIANPPSASAEEDQMEEATPLDDLVLGPIAEIIERLTDIRESYWGDMEEIADETRRELVAAGLPASTLDDIVAGVGVQASPQALSMLKESRPDVDPWGADETSSTW